MPEHSQSDEARQGADTANLVGHYRINLDGTWLFEEISELPHLYLQVYGFFAEMEAPRPEVDFEYLPSQPIDFRRFNYPWAGGWSAANFYRGLVRNLRDDAVPRVVQIQFASPGFIELSLWLAAAAAVRRCINETAKTASIVNKTYDEIYKGMHARQLLALDVRKKTLELAGEEMAFVAKARKQLANAIGLTEREAEGAVRLGPGTSEQVLEKNDLGTVKMLMSLTRRIIGLAKFEEDGKAKF
jgi:hypothetical protein